MLASLPAESVREAERALYQHGFLLKEQLGGGGSAWVYEVQSRKYPESQRFALKIIDWSLENPTNIDSFTAEVSALQVLAHPNVIRLFDSFRSDHFLYLILEHCPGSMRMVIDRQGAIPSAQLRRYALDLASALRYCHRQNIAHRDIKPSNILIDKYGRAKLADFGLAMLSVHQNQVSSQAGSLVYLAPEVLLGRPFNPMRTDIWSFGVTLFEMATSALPWHSQDYEGTREEIIAGTFTMPRTVPDDVAAAILKMLVVDPAERVTAADLVDLEMFHEHTKRSLAAAIGASTRRSAGIGGGGADIRASQSGSLGKGKTRMTALSTFGSSKVLMGVDIAVGQNFWDEEIDPGRSSDRRNDGKSDAPD
jgi:serine/threonine protein kinase